MNRQNRFLQYKRIQNGLPAYDLAAKDTSSGYQQGDSFTVGTPSIQTGQDINADIDAQTSQINQNIIPNALKQGINSYNLFKGQVAQQATKGLANMFADNLAQKGAEAGAANIVGQLSKIGTQSMLNGGLSSINGAAAKEAAANAMKGTAKAAAGTASSIVGGLGAAYSAYDLYKGLTSGINTPTTSQLDQARTTTNQTFNGVNAEQRYMGDTSGYNKLINAQNTNRYVSNAIKGAGLGFGIGSFLPGFGNLIGAGIGALIGGIGSLFGNKKKKAERELERRRNALANTYANYNAQAESEAASEGLRNQFNDSTYSPTSLYSANVGKSSRNPQINYDVDGTPNAGYRMVYDAEGRHPGIAHSVGGKNETIVNFNKREMTYIDRGKKRVDNQYLGVKEGDDNYIAGNDIDWQTGKSFADEVAPYSKKFGELRKMQASIQNNKYANEKTKQLNLQQIQRGKDELIEYVKGPLQRQDMQHRMERKYDGYMPKYDSGKQDYMKNIGNALARYAPTGLLAYALSLPNRQLKYFENSVPTAQNRYVPNVNANRSLGLLGSRHFDPYNQVNAVRDANRQNLYNIMQMGGLSLGQRAKMAIAQNNNYMQNLANIYSKANEVNDTYKQQLAQAAMEAGDRDATRQQQALAQQQQAYREAVARRLLGIENANQGRLNILGQIGKNIFQQQQFNRTQDYNNRLLGLYDRQLDLDKSIADYDAARQSGNQKAISNAVGNMLIKGSDIYSGPSFRDRLLNNPLYSLTQPNTNIQYNTTRQQPVTRRLPNFSSTQEYREYLRDKLGLSLPNDNLHYVYTK